MYPIVNMYIFLLFGRVQTRTATIILFRKRKNWRYANVHMEIFV